MATEPQVKITRYEVSCLPEGVPSRHGWMLRVEYRGRDTWAVTDNHMCLGNDGCWDYEPMPSERTDEWITRHRFDLDTALALAKEHAQTITINGYTAADVLRVHERREGGTDGD